MMNNIIKLSVKYFVAFLTGCSSFQSIFAENSTSTDVDLNTGIFEQLATIRVTAEAPVSDLNKQMTVGVLGHSSVLNTPFSMTAIDDADIVKRGADTLGQVFIKDPAIYSQSTTMSTNWWGVMIRGLPVRNFYIDEIPAPPEWLGDYPTEFTENITVLKGLTGYMYGFGAPGGAIDYQLKRPKSTPETKITFGYRNPSVMNILIDQSDYLHTVDMRYRFILGTTQGEAYNGSGQNRYIGSFALDKKISDNVNWTTNFSYENKKTLHEPPIFLLGNLTVGLPKPTYAYDDFLVDNSFYKSQLFTANTAMNWQFSPDWSLKYQLGYTQKLHQFNFVFNSLVNAAGDYNGFLTQFAYLEKSFAHQLMLSGNLSTENVQHHLHMGFGNTKSWLKTSSYYSDKSPRLDDYVDNLYQKQNYLIAHHPDFSLNATRSVVEQSYAFLSDKVQINDQFQTILGLRYTSYDAEDSTHHATSNSGYSTQAATPTLALIYKPLTNMTVYLNYVESLEEGQRVSSIYKNAGEVLNATRSKQHELGIKYDTTQFFATAALFKIQRTAIIENENNELSQDGLTYYRGLELNASFKPIDSLTIGAGMMYLDAKIDKKSQSSAELTGNRPESVPKYIGTLNAEYLLNSLQGLSLHGNVRYNGKSYATNSNILEIPAYALVNAGLSYSFTIAQQDIVLNANINNIFNKKYWASNSTFVNIGEGRNAVLSCSIKW
ncbi:TonB-dependent siderophore receptor [Acinetobacter sp. MD2]|uniref:TonB-dependent siderophore receptor n=1 Tax=Acinetobacter sp. MD2 TaxID=2600066 RepID=UPI002D1F6EF0|nr:TonB-dependent siderophore receptor [Acinetobacter sp. MD2]MEB3767316.1 TonB-dependent siderophore receptor [Acinetobacter sp. MD2]